MTRPDRGRIAAGLLLALAVALWSSPSRAQRLFGQNKVVYEGREWLVFREGMLEVYFYPAEEELARFTLDVARETYAEYAEWFGFEFEDPIPLILYPTHHDLKQTHIIPSFVGDSTAGFTEFIKGRIALRGTGNRAELRHLIRHEMVHAFMISEMAKTMTAQGIYDYEGPPLWFIEGLAESVARDGPPDAEARLILRDAVLNDGLVPLPEMWRIWGSFQMYKQGESILDFMRQQYGDRTPALLLDHWYLGRDFRDILRIELGLTLEELDRAWRNALKRRFYPEMLKRRMAEEQGECLDPEAWYDTMPAVVGADSSGGVDVVSVTGREAIVGLWRIQALGDGPTGARKLIESGRQARFETIPLLRSPLDVRDGRWFCFVAKNGATDRIYVYDLEEGRVVDEIHDRDLVEISSPALSPDLGRVVFSALARGGQSDLYVYDVEAGRLRRLTDDPFHDVDCAWHPSGERVVFASDRGDPDGGRHSLYEIDADGASPPRPLVTSPADDTAPRWNADGSVLGFLSDRDGTKNLYRMEAGADTVRSVTNLVGGIFGWDFTPDGRVVASVFERRRFRLFAMEAGARTGGVIAPARLDLPPTRLARPSPPDARPEAPPPQEYEIELGLDFVQSVVALDPDLPYGTGASFGFSDLLGSHQVYAHISSATDQLKLVDLNVGLSYSNFSSRWAQHVGVFRVAVRPRLTIFADTRYSEVRTGAFYGLTYPLSRYRRFEVSTVWRRLVRDETFGLVGEAGNTWLASLYGSFVHDNTLWNWNGPRRGWRFNLTLGESLDLMGRGFDRQTVQFDLRRYDELLPQTVLALRAQWRGSFGGDTEFFYLGGPNDFRGVDWFALRGEQTLLGNVEIRLPLVDHLALGFPFGGMQFPPIRGALFHDFARVTAASGITSIDAPFNDERWLGSFGASLMMTLFPPLVVRTDFARVHDYDRITDWRVDFSLSFLY